MKKLLCFIFTSSMFVVPLYTREVGQRYKRSNLPYAYNALEPYINEEIMRLHHTKHEQAYVNNLNAALEKHPKLFNRSLESLLQNLASLPKDIRASVRNNGGGVKNHQDFWLMMTPQSVQKPTGALARKIVKTYGSFAAFKKAFEKKAKAHFGSGWVWLCKDKKGNLSLHTTKDQDTPLSKGYTPLLALDLWEHAYYLQYKNRRSDYIASWWNIANWKQVEKNYKKAIAKERR